MDTPVKLVAIGDPDGSGSRILAEYLEVGDRKLMLKLEDLARNGSPLIGYLPSYGEGRNIYLVRDPYAFLKELQEYYSSRWAVLHAKAEAISHLKRCPELTWAFYAEE